MESLMEALVGRRTSNDQSPFQFSDPTYEQVRRTLSNRCACHPQGDLDEFQDEEYTFLGRRRPLHDFVI
jgi:hypothetical protein